MRATQHSGRMGSPRHNDRSFDKDKASHIDKSMTSENKYKSYDGLPFAEAEKKFYQDHFQEMINDINERARKVYHPERMTDVDKLLQSKNTMPEEVILQIGNKDTHVTPKQLEDVAEDFRKWHNRKFGKHVVFLNMALHVDEKTPHIHIRRVWIYEHEKGFKAIGQHKALEQMGYELPDKSKPRGRNNNLKQVYTAECREKWLEICKKHGLEVEEKPLHKAPNEQNLKKNDYILQKQEYTLKKNEGKMKKIREMSRTINIGLQNQKRAYEETKEKLLKGQIRLEEQLSREKCLEEQIRAKMGELESIEGRILTAEEVMALNPKKTLLGKADISYQDVLNLIRTAEHVETANQMFLNSEKIVQKMVYDKKKEKAAADILEEAKNELSFDYKFSREKWQAEIDKMRKKQQEQYQQPQTQRNYQNEQER